MQNVVIYAHTKIEASALTLNIVQMRVQKVRQGQVDSEEQGGGAAISEALSPDPSWGKNCQTAREQTQRESSH